MRQVYQQFPDHADICTLFAESLINRTPWILSPPGGRGSVSVNSPNLATIPLDRPGTPEEVAAAVTFLASDDASFTTAESICVGGGAFCRL